MALQFDPAISGGWLAIATASRVLVVGGSVAPEFLDAASRTPSGDSGLQAILDLLTSKGLSATPPFALVDWSAADGAVRAVVRGEVSVSVTSDGGTDVLSGAGVSTWIEKHVTSVSSCEIAVSAAVSSSDFSALPLVEGAAVVARVAVGVGASLPPAGKLGAASSPPGAAAEPAAAEPARAEPTHAEPARAEPARATPPAQPVAPVVSATPAPAAPAPATSAAAAPAPAPAAAAPAPAAPAAAAAPVHEAADIGATVTSLPTPEDSDADGYDFLFGATMYRSVADAAVRADVVDDEHGGDAQATPVETDDGSSEGDHDGHTVLTSDLAAIRAKRKASSRAVAAPAVSTVPNIVLSLSTGTTEQLTQPMLFGRAPSVSKVSGGQMPRLITVGGADQDISRNHAQIALEGDTVVVTDLHSRNGTMIVLPGKSPQKLRAGEPTPVIIGTVVDLGGGITVTVDEK